MNEEKRTEIQKWLIKAQHDLGSARRLMEGKGEGKGEGL